MCKWKWDSINSIWRPLNPPSVLIIAWWSDWQLPMYKNSTNVCVWPLMKKPEREREFVYTILHRYSREIDCSLDICLLKIHFNKTRVPTSGTQMTCGPTGQAGQLGGQANRAGRSTWPAGQQGRQQRWVTHAVWWGRRARSVDVHTFTAKLFTLVKKNQN